jgi:transposase
MFQDEARFGRISDPRRSWAPKPIRPMCKAMCVREYTYAYAAVEVRSGEVDSLILPKANTECMQIFLDEVASRHSTEKIVMVLDGASWHKSTSLNAPENMRLVCLPAYAPELNPVEHIWDELREKFFHNKVFDSLRALEKQLMTALKSAEENSEKIKSIVAWDWIINALLI